MYIMFFVFLNLSLMSFMCAAPLNFACAVKQTEQNNRRSFETVNLRGGALPFHPRKLWASTRQTIKS